MCSRHHDKRRKRPRVFIASLVWRDTQDSPEVQPPGCDRPFTVLRAEKSRNRISFIPFGDIPLDPDHGPGIGMDRLTQSTARLFDASPSH